MEGKVVGCNARALEVVGAGSVEEVLGKDFVGELVTEGGKACSAAAMEKALGGEDQLGGVVELVGKDGYPVRLDGDTVHRQGCGGEVAGTIVSGVVVKSEPSWNELLGLLDKQGIAAWFTDRAGAVGECNATACVLVGRSREEQQGMGLVGELVSERDRGEAGGAVAKALEEGEESLDLFVGLLGVDGEVVEVRAEVAYSCLQGKH